MPPETERPRQVTLAAFLVIGASVLLVASVFERLGTLRSLESRTAVQRFLSEPPGSNLGIGTETVLEILRTVSMVAAGLATAAAILGYHVLKRNRSARVALTVLAVPLFMCGLVTGGFLASVVAASSAMLWLAPARLWFSGETVPGAEHPVAPVPPPARTDLPPPWPSYGEAPRPAVPPHPVAPGQADLRRPVSVVVACGLTWVCCAFVALVSVLLMAVLAADADGLFAEMHRQNPTLADQGISDSTLETATWITGGVCLVWSLVAAGLAVLTFLRVRWAGIALIVSATVVALLCLAGSLVSPALVVPGVLAAVVGVLLLRPGAHQWFERRPGGPVQGPPAGPWS
jgi:hypothetical protein